MAGQSFAVDEAQVWIGAHSNNHVPLADDGNASGNHACIAYENDGLAIYDNRSTNGLFVNEERVTEGRRVLQAGDRVRVGRSVFVVRRNDSA